MLLPDNIYPELSVYYNGGLILKILREKDKLPIINLYQRMKELYEISFPTFILCLDWLYLIDAAHINEKGCVELCS